MFFLIRSVFWLTIVFTSMSWTVDASQPAQPHALRDAVLQGGMAMVGAAEEAAINQAHSWCIKSPKECLSDAARLTALVMASQTEDIQPDVIEPGAQGDAVPVPHPDPRRHAPPRG